MNKQSNALNARKKRRCASNHTVRREKVFERYSFDNAALDVFALAAQIAQCLDDTEVYCSHVFAACAIAVPDVMHKLLGRKLSKLPSKFDLGLEDATDIEDDALEEVDFSTELASIFLDSVPGTPLQFSRAYFSGKQIGIAEVAFALMMEATEEIADILIENGFSNDGNMLTGLLRENYLKNLHFFSPFTQEERRNMAVDMAGFFEEYMNLDVCGQKSAVAKLASSLTDFWCKGNRGKPYVVLLLSKQGGGRSYFADRMQNAFVEMELQERIEPPLDMSSFVNREGSEVDLLGDAKSYKCAKSGMLNKMTRANKRGLLVFEDILDGCRNATNILRSFTQNLAIDKFEEEALILPLNVIVLTMRLSDEEYGFIAKKSDKELDAALLNSILLRKDRMGMVNEQAANCSLLWQRADSIILLKQLDECELEKMAMRRMETLVRTIKDDFGIALTCNDIPELVRLVIQSSHEELCPRKLLDAIDGVVQEKKLWENIRRNPGLKEFEIVIPQLPVYPHAPERRIARGDYLDFKKCEELDGTTLRLTFKDIQYKQRDRIDCSDYRIEHPKGTTFTDIYGLDDVRDELLDALDYITGSDEYRELMPPPCLNFILYGPPGTGKTSMAVALANSADIPVFFATSSIFADSTKLGDMFRKANEMAPAIVVLEEFNSIGDASREPWRREAVNELLAILDGVQEQGKLLVLASTNYLDQIEVALRRSGRFGRKIKIDLPVAEARESFIRTFEAKFKFTLNDTVRSDFVAATAGINFADLKGVLEFALRRSIRAKKQLDAEMLDAALQEFQVARNSRMGIGFGAEK